MVTGRLYQPMASLYRAARIGTCQQSPRLARDLLQIEAATSQGVSGLRWLEHITVTGTQNEKRGHFLNDLGFFIAFGV